MWFGHDDEDDDDSYALRAKAAREQEEYSRKFNIRYGTPKRAGTIELKVGQVQVLSEPEPVTAVKREVTVAESNVNRIPHDEDEGSQFRYMERVMAFKADGAPWPRLRHFAFWVAHNAVAHPLLGLFPGVATVQLHEVTSSWLSHDEAFEAARRVLHAKGHVPKVTKKGPWLFHNLVAHPLIAFLPCKATFSLHDWSAHRMGVPGWI